MIGTNDLVKPYERFNIHPGNKSGVGHRLASLALNKKYGKKQFMCESPKYKSHKVKGMKYGWRLIRRKTESAATTTSADLKWQGPTRSFIPR